uniref:fructose-specific PTS transporter subunit EIIC n=1 Tax=Thaumasiovibrio occultus TaxID=1891184 RepID=UPI000B363262|nr:fructose-specific PTS transporter subunit EIIC [Thaumasiovibrio occultus]
MNITSLIDGDTICIDLHAHTKEQVLAELVEMLAQANKLADKDAFLRDIWKREQIGNTGFEDGVAIPHAKSSAVAKPAVAIGISRKGIDYGAEDDELSQVFFMLASPNDNDHHHIEVLAQLSAKLIEEDFIAQLKAADSVEHVLALLAAIEAPVEPTPPIAEPQPISPLTQRLVSMKQHLLFGTSHMIPFIVAGGVLLSLSIMISGQGAIPRTGLLADIAAMGVAGLTLFTLVLGGYIAYSIADKPGLAPGMIGAWIAESHYNTGFLGAIVVGFIAGLTVSALKKIRLPESMSSLSAIFIYPLMGTFITCGAVMWLIGAPMADAMSALNNGLAGLADSGKIVLGTVLGAMTAFDMGGPINKVATLFAQAQINTQPWLMGGVGIAICTPPLGMALATVLAPKKFSQDEREAGKAAGIMGMIGISEGAIPFAVADPARVLPAVIIGGILGNVLGFIFHVACHAPWGGWIVLPVVEGKLGYVLGILAGSFTTAAIAIALKKNVTDMPAPTLTVAPPPSVDGYAEILAVTSCPSGVAHTFLAAKSLEKAAAQLGVKIKVETQGANGIINKINPYDVAHARLVILAHDVAIKEPERFANSKTLDVSTKDAMLDAAGLLKVK